MFPTPDATLEAIRVGEATVVPDAHAFVPSASVVSTTLTAGVDPLWNNGSLDDASFVDVDYAWVLFETTLYATRDGGQTWQAQYVTFPRECVANSTVSPLTASDSNVRT